MRASEAGAAATLARTRLVRNALLACLLLLAAVIGAGAPAHAEDDPAGNGFLMPFPPGDAYAVQVIGDTLAEGILGGLTEALGNDPRLKLPKKHRNLNGLLRNDFDDDMKALEEQAAKEPFQIAILMLGVQDRVQSKGADGKRIAIGSDAWKAEYGRRVDRLMKICRKNGTGVYWVSLPAMRRSEANDDAQMMNEIVRERAYLNGLRFIDVMANFADEQGGYADSGPDITGKIRRLRESDGINFTDAGNRKLAHFVEKELKRDLAQAKQDRNIPLAGDASEQAAISAAAKAQTPTTPAAAGAPAAGSGWAPTVAIGQQQASGQPSASAAVADGEQKADNGRISIKSLGANGKEEVLTIDVLRPAIPASVVALVTRKESADKPSQMGDSLIDQIQGGLTVMSSITPANEAGGAARRKVSPTQSPYFRVLVKGERLTARVGRADDLMWPRPEPAPVPDPPAATPPAAAAPAAPAAKDAPTKAAKKARDRG